MEEVAAASAWSNVGGGDGGDGGGHGDRSSASNPTQKEQDEPESTSAEFPSLVPGRTISRCTINICERVNEFTHRAETLMRQKGRSTGGWNQPRGVGLWML